VRLPLHASVPKLAFPRPRASTTWTIPSTATLSPSYTIKVTVHDDGLPSLSASAQSGALTSGSPPQQVSFSTQLVPLLKNTTDGCIKMGCHGATNPQQGLDLTAANAFSNIVNKPATQTSNCSTGAELVGSGNCMTGSRMPKGEAAFPSAKIQLWIDWTLDGAPNN